MQVLQDPADGLPLLSNVVPAPGVDGAFIGVITLIIDDPEAQALASEAVEKVMDESQDEPMVLAEGIFGLDVTFKRPVPNVLLRRRVTTGVINDHTVPIMLSSCRPNRARRRSSS